MKKNKPLILHPFLFAMFPVLFLYSYNVSRVYINQVSGCLMIAAIFAFLLFFLMRMMFKNAEKAGVTTSLFLLLSFSYGHFYNIIEGWRFTLGKLKIGPEGITSTIWLMTFFIGIYFFKNLRAGIHNFTKVSNVVGIFLIIIPLLNIGVYNLRISIIPKEELNVKNLEPVSASLVKNAPCPNIYYIILDGYARADILDRLYGFDNSKFLDYLAKKGFYTARKSRSNYFATKESMASSLNFEYLTGFTKRKRDTIRILENNRVAGFLKERGYKIINFYAAPYYSRPKEEGPFAIKGLALTEFQNMLITTTPFPFMFKKMYNHITFDKYRERISSAFDYLEDTCKLQSPLFVFVYIGMPHPPFVFNREGESVYPMRKFLDYDAFNIIRKNGLTRTAYRKYYIDQLIYTNKRVEKTIGTILSQSASAPVIILQGDHGPRSTLLSWDDPRKSDLEEIFSIFNAYYLPGKINEILYDEITPVNTFRIIFNRYFGTRFKLLDDKSYHYHLTSVDFIYKYVDVTDKINQ